MSSSYHSEPRFRRAGRIRVLGFCCFCLLLIMFLGLIAANLFGVRVYRITGDSMSPTIRRGEVILTLRVDAKDLRVGDIITASHSSQSRTVTHRIIALEKQHEPATARLQGDANPAPDPSTYPVETAQRYVFTMF